MMWRSGVSLVPFLCMAGVAHAGDKPLYQPAPGWVLAAPAPEVAKLSDADPALVILDQQQRVSDGQLWSYVDQAVRAVTAQMLSEVGQVKLAWQPDAGDLIIHRAQILRGGEVIDLVAGAQPFQVLRREEQLEQRQLNGVLTATLQAEGLRVGDVLRVAYSTTISDKALQGNVQAAQGLLAAPNRAKFARARLSWPVGTDLRWRTYVDGLKPAVVTKGGFNEVEIAMPLAKLPELPADAPARYRKLPILEVSSFADWASISRVMAPLYKTDGLIAPGSPLAAEVAKIAATSQDQRVRAAAALRLVQDEVRYLFNGMAGGNYVPQSPGQTWTLRYGDCKAKTLLLLAMLRALDIEAEAVAANINLGDQVPGRLPSAGAFDHVLVLATIGGKSLWLDGTGSGTRLADLDDVPPFRHVLPLRAKGAELLSPPARAPARPLVEIDIDYDQRAGLRLPTPFTLELRMRGPMAGMGQAASSQMTREQRNEAAQGTAERVLGGGAVIFDSSMGYDAETGTATMRATGIAGSPWTVEQSRYRMPLDKIVSEVSFAPDRARPAWKDIPVAGAGPATVIYRTKVTLPAKGDGFVLEGDQNLPAMLGGARIKRTTTLANGVLHVEDRVENTGDEIAAADIPAARSQMSLAKNRLLKIAAPEAYPSGWRQVEEARRSGALQPILAGYGKAIAQAPDEAGGYSTRADFHISVWDWKMAKADLDKAIGIAPSADLYLRRASVLQQMKDDAAALKDAEAALALDPSSMGAVNTVATLRFREGDQDGALAMIAERIDAGGDEQAFYVTLQADLLAEAKRPDEAIAAMDGAVKTSPGKADLLNSRCWLKGTLNVALDTALKDCTRAIEIAEQPAAIYDSRALVYYRMGRIDDALGDLNAALEVAPEMTASLYLRGVILKKKGDKAGDADLAAARLMWPRIDEQYARYGVTP
ncbi:DUF3857 domain-containing protein [Sphingomonas sp. IC-56]|uniref:DUF3857 domain-containing protein n=1 Tax=Sphingomonas sp. IC-56 TaxID=2898529 RepID=UPI001E351D6D|nr:DUF3857 domain-containing protein [Sphingomonas sp. IC-56]MCD2324728.1 DUF3857 domain-containing protein [Sphingomonas sp. IC-56]